jgi:hypothetical protein
MHSQLLQLAGRFAPENKISFHPTQIVFKCSAELDKSYSNQRHSVNFDQVYPAQARSNSGEVRRGEKTIREAIMYACTSDFYDY